MKNLSEFGPYRKVEALPLAVKRFNETQCVSTVYNNIDTN